MVTPSSPAIQANEHEKRRKQTWEKSRVTFLSRQLRLRLQYARLKVEHGWQKQSLNEVENLYFHHSHSRGLLKQYPLLATTHTDPVLFSTSPASQTQSSLSFKLGTLNLFRTPTGTSGDDATTNANHPDSVSIATTNSHPPSYSVVTPLNTHYVSGTNTPNNQDHYYPSPANKNSSEISLQPTTSQNYQPQPQPISTQSHILMDTTPISNMSTTSPPPNHYPNVKPQKPRVSRTQSSQKSMTSLTAKDLFAFGSGSLTYDSFWSSHSGPTTPRNIQITRVDTSSNALGIAGQET